MKFHIGNFTYKVFNDRSALITKLDGYCYRIKVPSEISSPEGKRYKVIGFSNSFSFSLDFATIISFDESSEIEEIPTNFISLCKSKFYLPPRIKRVKCISSFYRDSLQILSTSDNRFVSAPRKKILINHYPLELVISMKKKSHLFIRETVRIIGKSIFENNNNIVSVVFPSSVEIIGRSSFLMCKSLRFIKFKGNSRLKVIGKYSFSSSSIERIDFPPSVEKIGCSAFGGCMKLRSISFPNDSKLRKIGNFAFGFSGIECIDMPASVTEIEMLAFKNCTSLRSVSFHEDSKLKKIACKTFAGSSIEHIKIPSSVEKINDESFERCMHLRSVEFPEDSRLKTIGRSAFSISALESINIPASVELIEEKAFSDNKNLRTVIFQNKSNISIREGAFDKTPYMISESY